MKVMSTIASHSPLNRLSRKPLEIEALIGSKGWITNRKWPMGYQMVTWPMTSIKLVTPICLEPNIDHGAVKFRRLTKSNFPGVEVVDWP